MRQLIATLLLAAALAAQATDCPKPADVRPQDLFGLWHATFEGMAHGATLLLEKHPQWADSVGGAINRNGERGVLSGELEDGEFNLEESADGTHIFATWVGAVVEGSCGREIRGTWQRDGAAVSHDFVLRKR